MSAGIKRRVYALCMASIEQRIANAQAAIASAQEAANEESKSSAGDKYETTRAQMHLEMEQNATQLNDALKLKNQLLLIDPQKSTETIQAGSLVVTDQGKFFISVSAGQLRDIEDVYFAISLLSPLGNAMHNLKVSDKFRLNGKAYEILEIL